jgi:hypothetical protein
MRYGTRPGTSASARAVRARQEAPATLRASQPARGKRARACSLMVNLLRGAGQTQMRTPVRLATANAHALPASIAFEYPFATLRSGPYWHAMRRDEGAFRRWPRSRQQPDGGVQHQISHPLPAHVNGGIRSLRGPPRLPREAAAQRSRPHSRTREEDVRHQPVANHGSSYEALLARASYALNREACGACARRRRHHPIFLLELRMTPTLADVVQPALFFN